MWSKLVDLGVLIELRDCISGMTKLDYAAYDHTGHVLIPPLSEDSIITTFLASEKGKGEQELFMKNALEKAVLRKGPSVSKGPMNQYHAFIPVHTADRRIVLVSNAFYASTKNLEDFISLKGVSYRLHIKDLSLWKRKIMPRDLGSIAAICEYVHRLANLTMKNNYEKNLFRERGLKISAIMELFSEIERDMSRERLYSMLCDAMLFLFGADTASVMLRTGNQFLSVVASGNLRTYVEKVPLRSEVSVIADAVSNRKAAVFTESLELLRLGYPEKIESLYLFPLAVKDDPLGLLCVFNSPLSEEDSGSVMKLCNFSAFLLKTIIIQELIDANTSTFVSLNRALDMSPAFQDPNTLYESIVELSSQLTDAERVSLMLPGEEQEELLITAVKGINKWIAKNIRVKIGEGVAGRVYQEGKPLIVRDIEDSLSTAKKPNYRTGSFASIPLKVGDESIGVLNLADKITGEVFSEEDMLFLRYFASYASIAIRGSQYYRKSEELRTLSVTDPLTGLFNRRYFNDRLYEELERGLRYDYVFSLAIFDIDDFKLFNDTEGHLAGDEILKAVAEISKESLRSIDIISRFGGEEFSIIMPQTNREEALLVAERVRKNIRELLPTNWKVFPRDRITVSVGLATFPADAKDAKTLIRNVDKALYRAKLSGKDKTVLWETFNPSENIL